MKRNILLTFDYELFLGMKSGSVENCLLKPTEQLLKILSRNNAKAIFFIDTTYILRLESMSMKFEKAKKDFDKINEQLIKIAGEGHYLFHHLHPHWLDATYSEELNQWSLEETKKFLFQSLSMHEKENLFKFSYSYLSSIYKKAQKETQSDGYRAGGLFLEPFSSIVHYFDKYSITNEFSVVSGLKKDGEEFNYDYTNSPKNRIYNFETKIAKEEKGGKYTEYPISMLSIKGFTKIVNGVYYRLTLNKSKNKPFGDGLSVGNKINARAKKSFKKYFILSIAMSIELLTPVLVHLYKKKIKQNTFVHLISHPKLISTCSLISFEKVLEYCIRKYDVEFDFKRMG